MGSLLLRKQQKEHLSERVLGGFIVVVPVVLAVLIFLYFNRFAVNRLATRAQTVPFGNAGDSQLPVKIVIPKINVNARIQGVGLTKNGKMEVPEKPEDTGWYSFGKRPGEAGSAVIAGHYGVWNDGKVAVFNKINKLNSGDKILVENGDGGLVSFIVRESREYDPTADASKVFYSSDGKSHLNLITCEGVWNNDSKSYSQRLVVFADQE